MNKHLHRIVFNAARGMRMVVQETAMSAGKATGATSGVVATALAGLLAVSPAPAQIVGAPGVAPNLRPTVLVAPNGVPLVNIQTPSAAGVSRNLFNQFDVQRNGAILNNSRTDVQTQLGGFVQGNPYLARGTARIILNEITSGNPTQLRGYVEVGGQRAEVIIANPAGIAVDGGGFINASRATLTTGTPQLNAQGGLDSYVVRGGTISIDGAGLDLSRTDYAAILARAVQVNAGLWANELKVVTGANQVSADHGQISPTAGTGPTPTFALDVAQLGGMYAGKITLIGTEAGLGARNAGTIQAANGAGTLAGAGQLVVTAAGRLENIGTLQATAGANLNADSLANSGRIAAGGELKVATQGTLGNAGGTLEGPRVELASAGGDIDNRGGTIRQTSSVGLTVAGPSLSNTAGGVIGVEPIPETPAQPSPGTGTGGTGTGGTTDPGTPTTGGSGGTDTGSGGGTAPSQPYVPPAPGSLTAAGSILNDGGRIYAGGAIALQTPQVNNNGGSLTTTSLAASGPSFSNVGGTVNVANNFSAHVDHFDNTGGSLRAGSLNIAATGDLVNQDGKLDSNGNASLSAGGALDNTRGTVSAAGSLTANASGTLDNSAGTLLANQGVALDAQSLNNSKGSIQSATAGTRLTVANQLQNAEGAIGAATDLSVQAGSLSSSGSLRGSNDTTLDVAGALVNDGSITAGRHTTVTAGSLQSPSTLRQAQDRPSSGQAVLGAGIQADGKFGSTGDLRMTTTGALVATGTQLAAGDAVLQGASMDLSSSTTSAANIALTATQGNVTTSGATVVTPGTLSVAANAQPGQTLVNDAGILNAGQLDLRASNIANTNGGEIVQTGIGATTIATSGAIDNTQGRIATNGEDLSLSAASITNTGGKIEHAGSGTLSIAGGSYSGANGQITGNGALVVNVAGAFNQDGGSTYAEQTTIDAGALSNQGGKIVQGEAGATRITVVAALNNNAGTIASNGNTIVAAGSLSNQAGTIRAAETSNLGLTVGGMLDNSNKGEIGAGGSTTLNAGSLNNDAGRITAVGDLSTTTSGATSNQAGTIAANGNTTMNAASLNNNGGTVAAVTGKLQVTTSGATTNAGGSLQAGGAAVLSSAGLDNAAGKVFGNSLSVDTHGQALTNAQGTLAATTTIDIQSGALDNNAGLIQSGGAMTVDTNREALSNTHAAGAPSGSGGSITSADTLTLKTGTVNNARGFIGSKNALDADTLGLSNTGGGLVLGQANVAVNTNGATYNNSGGQTQAAIDLSIAAGDIGNTGGLLRSMQTTTLNAGTLVNASTQGTNQGIEGKNVALLTGGLNNNTGAIRADLNATITSGGSVDNTAGLISAGDTLTIKDPSAANPAAKALNLINANGTLVADKTLKIDAAKFSGDGKAVSGIDLSIALTQNIVNNAEVAANGNLTYTTTGDFTNNGKLLAGETLTVGGNNVENTADAEMSGKNTTVNAASTLTNRGLIDSKSSTQINAGTLNNTGTGRIYGSAVSIRVGTLNNERETVNGVARSATIASRGTLNIGADTINNLEHSLIFSEGKMSIGATLDANRQAAGQGSVLNNLSAEIESIGDMSISMGQINNRDVHIQRIAPSVSTSNTVRVAPVTSLGGEAFYPMDEVRLDPFNGVVYRKNGEGSETLVGMNGYGIWNYTTTTTEDRAINLDPARIVAGGEMTLNGHLYNQDSRVTAGGAINVASMQPEQMQGQRTTTGYAIVTNHKGEVAPLVILSPTTETLSLGAYKYEQNTKATQGYNPGAASTANANANAGATGGVSGGNGPGTVIEVPANVGAVVKTSGSSADAAGGAGGASGTGASQSIPMVVRTSTPNASVPTASLFNTRPDPGSRYLIETDPRFANYRNWLNSDYLLDKLGLNPDVMQKRLGDGFYEQRLIREQVAQLTGYRYLDGFTSDEGQYAALMNAGATFALQYGLRPGVALTAAQMAQLTSDIVWLVEQTATLPNGSSQRVLVPQLYVRVRPGDIDGSGALLSADATVIKSSGDLVNTGTIAGRSMVSISAENVNNLGGRIAGGSVGINARNDINNIGGSITADNAAVLTAGGDINIRTTTQSVGGAVPGTNIDRIAGVYVSNPGGVLIASAGRDVNLIGAALVSAGSASVGAGRNINLGTVTEASGASVFGQGIAGVTSQSREIGSVIQANDNVRLAAGNDLNIRAGAVASIDGALVATAKNDINLTAGQATSSIATATVSSSSSLLKKSSSSTVDSTSVTSVVSSSLSGNTVALVAGNNINAQAAQLRSDEAMSLSAGRDINFTTATQTTQEAHASQSKTSATGLGSAIGTSLAASGLPSGMFAGAALTGGRSANGAEASTRNDAIGTSVSAGSLQMVSGRDTTLQAATVVTDGDIAMIAGRNLTIESAHNTSVGSSYSADSKSGMIGTWYNPSVGNVKSSEAVATTRTTQASSQVASLQGNVTLVAGGTYTQTASSVMAAGLAGPLVGGDVNILAKNVVINKAYNTEQSVSLTHQSSTVMGGSASIGGLSTDGIKGASSTIKAMGETSDGRMQALGAVNLAMSGKQAYDSAQALANGGQLSYGVSVNLSRNESQSSSVTTSSQAVGSSVLGSNNVNIVATGGGTGSNILASGSTIAAGNTVNLTADNDITLQASKDTSVTMGQNSSSGANVGVTFGAGAQNGFSIQLGVSQGKGSNNQDDTRYNATQVSGGKAVNIASGGDLTLNGAVVEAHRVTADVGGDLSIATLQDVSVGQSRQSSSGLNVSLCIPPICYGAVVTASASAAGAKSNGVFVSPNTQSGIKAGDGGFDVNVRGNTTLTGAVIESTQAANDAGKNSFNTGGTLTMSDLQNVSQSSGSSYAVSGGVSLGYTTQADGNPSWDPKEGQQAVPPSGSVGLGSDSGNSQNSTTRSGISGIAGDQSVRTGDSASAGTLVKDWNTQTIVRDVQAQAQITQQFNQNAAREIGTYADKQRDAALARDDEAEAAKWAEGGEYRVALHTAAGALSGGVAGAIGAGASAALMPRVGEAIAEMGLPTPVAQALGAVTAAAIGAAVGGAAGAASAYSVDINNRQLHPTEITWIKGNAKSFAAVLSEKVGHPVTEAEAARWLTLAGEGNTDSYKQTTNSNNLGSYASEEYNAYMAAKSFINQNAKSTFVDSTGRSQTLFSATASDFQNPIVYSEYKNNADYRDFYWETLQINLKPDSPTVLDQKTYDERQKIVNRQTLVDLATFGAAAGASAATIKYVNGRPVASASPTSVSGATTVVGDQDLPNVYVNQIPPRNWKPTVAAEDVNAWRVNFGVPDTLQTLSVARTDIPQLGGVTFGGASSAVYDAADLPRPLAGPIQSPNPNPLFRDHAEQDVANQFVTAVGKAGLKPSDLEGKTLNMVISNPSGVCTVCVQGLSNPAVAPGVLKQLSEMYPGLTINVDVMTVDGIKPRTGSHITILNGMRVN